jgi:hypothetical protein
MNSRQHGTTHEQRVGSVATYTASATYELAAVQHVVLATDTVLALQTVRCALIAVHLFSAMVRFVKVQALPARALSCRSSCRDVA